MFHHRSPRILARKAPKKEQVKEPEKVEKATTESAGREVLVLPVGTRTQAKFGRASVPTPSSQIAPSSSSRKRRAEEIGSSSRLNDLRERDKLRSTFYNLKQQRNVVSKPHASPQSIIVQLKMGLEEDQIVLQGGVAFHKNRTSLQKEQETAEKCDGNESSRNEKMREQVKLPQYEMGDESRELLGGIANKADLFACPLCIDNIFMFSAKSGFMAHVISQHPESAIEMEQSVDEFFEGLKSRRAQHQSVVLKEIRKQQQGTVATEDDGKNVDMGEKEAEVDDADLLPPESIRIVQPRTVEEYPRGCILRIPVFCPLLIEFGSNERGFAQDKAFCLACGNKVDVTVREHEFTPFSEHIKLHLASDEMRENFSTENLKKWGLLCAQCGLIFPSEQKLKGHMRKTHQPNIHEYRQFVSSTSMQKCLPLPPREKPQTVHFGQPLANSSNAKAFEIPIRRLFSASTGASSGKQSNVIEECGVDAERQIAWVMEDFLKPMFFERLETGNRERIPIKFENVSMPCGCVMYQDLVRPQLIVRHMVRCHGMLEFTADIQLITAGLLGSKKTRLRPLSFAVAPTGKVKWNCCGETFSSHGHDLLEHWKTKAHFVEEVENPSDNKVKVEPSEEQIPEVRKIVDEGVITNEDHNDYSLVTRKLRNSSVRGNTAGDSAEK